MTKDLIEEKDEWLEEIKKLKEKGVPSPKDLGLIDIPNSMRNKHND